MIFSVGPDDAPRFPSLCTHNLPVVEHFVGLSWPDGDGTRHPGSPLPAKTHEIGPEKGAGDRPPRSCPSGHSRAIGHFPLQGYLPKVQTVGFISVEPGPQFVHVPAFLSQPVQAWVVTQTFGVSAVHVVAPATPVPTAAQ